jgi:hypothetical protein
MSFSSWAQVPVEASWKTSLRTMISRVSPVWSEWLLGRAPEEVSSITLPEIPKNFKKNTDTSTYSKLQKEPTEYDKLPAERKRQFDYKFLEELFRVTRKSGPKDEDLSSWLNTLDQGGSREGIYQALVLDDVYATMENMDERPSDKLVKFSEDFAKKYLATNYSQDTLTKSNLFTLKRIMTEKSLDLMENYETKNLDDLYRWYAVFSADMAKNYDSFLKAEIRRDPSVEFHYQWAKSMPIQHIKSEFIIKLHTVMNGLQLLQ